MIEAFEKARKKPEPVPAHIRAKLLERAGELPAYKESSPKFPKQNLFTFDKVGKKAPPEASQHLPTNQLLKEFPLMNKLGAKHKVLQQLRNQMGPKDTETEGIKVMDYVNRR